MTTSNATDKQIALIAELEAERGIAATDAAALTKEAASDYITRLFATAPLTACAVDAPAFAIPAGVHRADGQVCVVTYSNQGAGVVMAVSTVNATSGRLRARFGDKQPAVTAATHITGEEAAKILASLRLTTGCGRCGREMGIHLRDMENLRALKVAIRPEHFRHCGV